ncbi:unnamed protein product, partial [Urochloa humidicola]
QRQRLGETGRRRARQRGGGLGGSKSQRRVNGEAAGPAARTSSAEEANPAAARPIRLIASQAINSGNLVKVVHEDLNAILDIIGQLSQLPHPVLYLHACFL